MVVTVTDNSKLLKYQKLEDGKLSPFFEIKKTEELGKYTFDNHTDKDWTEEINKNGECYHPRS